MKPILGLLAVAGLLVFFMAFKPLTEIKAWKQNIQPAVEDGGRLTAVSIQHTTGGYSSVACLNATSTAVYFGPSGVTADGGYPICTSTACADKVLSLDTYQGQLYVNVAAKVDGGVNINCISGF